jgi:hypothetical protein
LGLGLAYVITLPGPGYLDYVYFIKYTSVFLLYFVACNLVIIGWRRINNPGNNESSPMLKKAIDIIVRIGITIVLGVFFSIIADRFFDWLYAFMFVVYYWTAVFLAFISIKLENLAKWLLTKIFPRRTNIMS